MANIASATGHLVRLDLHDDGTLVLAPIGRVAAVWLFNDPTAQPLYLSPDMVSATLDTLPSDDGLMLGWIEFSTPGDPIRVPYRLKQMPHVRYLLREAALLGYPVRYPVGQAVQPQPVPAGV